MNNIGTSVLAFLLILCFMTSCEDEKQISYSEQIKPLLNKKCLRCHGGIRALGGFSLLFEDLALAPTESGKYAIVPGKPNASQLISRVRHSDPELIMPQEGAPLTEDEIQLLETWIKQGAKFEDHWSFKPIELPVVPLIDSAWATTDIDQFILGEMQKHGLTPSEKASISKLVRRLSFDLTGLPIDPAVAMGVIEEPSDHSWEALIDTLLASPHYGEHFASMWLDLARYADSNGYEKDGTRSVWRFRDWVINAFNTDMPFDQFTIEQLAGDLLPQPNKEQLIATAFHRNTMTNTEGGTEDEEFRTASVIDRVNTTFEAWQGITISCVQCHAHPYDPINHEEFYQVYALFNNTQDADMDSDYPYQLELPDSTADQIQEIAKWIKTLGGEEIVYTGMPSKADISRMVHPRLFGDFADDFQEVLIQSNGVFSNAAYNSNNQKYKQYYIVFNDIDLSGLTGIRYRYDCNGDDANIELYIDQISGEPVLVTQMVNPEEDGWGWLESNISGLVGKHDLIFHFVNTTGDYSTGVVTLKEVELVYKDKPIGKKVRAAQDSLLNTYRSGIKTPLLKEHGSLLERESHVFDRGNYLVPGAKVTGGVPKAINKDSISVTNRLELANWLVDNRNPLTARVMVNRIWTQIFGVGIVETPEDFGTQGMPPSHPELLDYLSYHFSNTWGWSIKRLIKEIVKSATYQQSSNMDSLRLEIDPYNKWLSRGTRIRLSAEQIRDQALAVSGLLVENIGGQSVMPPQPEGVWQVVYSSATWEAKSKEDNYRRALYTYWKRTTPYPSMVAFDTPSREFCVSRRIRTNTPIQALVTLNDTVYLEAAIALGAWMEEAGNGNVEEAIEKGFQKALLEAPKEDELAILMDLYQQSAVPISNMAGTDNRPLEPLTVVANAILNLDAFLTKS